MTTVGADGGAASRRWVRPRLRTALSVHRIALAAAVGVMAALAVGSLWAAASDRQAAKVLPEGTLIGGVDVGGLTPASAVDVLRRRVEAPLRRPMLVTAEGFSAAATPWDLGWRTDTARVVDRTLDESRRGALVGRLWRRWFGADHRSVDLKPSWHAGRLRPVLEGARAATYVAPKPARLDTSSGFVEIVPDSPGRELEQEAARRILTEAAERGNPRVRLPTVPIAADVGRDAFSTVVLVRTGENMLHLYKGGQIVKSYPVATGTAKYPTPTGTWKVTSRLVKPVWINPNSEWSARMPARIGPGPNNPLGHLALALNAPGILIHATPDTSSIGFSASHGCIRMLPADEEDLFGQVSVGTPVVIVEAGPPKDRNAARLPAPGSAVAPSPGAPVDTGAGPASREQEAATQF